MTDLPTQLRELHAVFDRAHPVLLEAADRLERLERELLGALQRVYGDEIGLVEFEDRRAP